MNKPDQAGTSSSGAQKAEWVAGAAVAGAGLVAIVAIVLAVVMMISFQWGHAAAFLLVAAVALGLLANALLRA